MPPLPASGGIAFSDMNTELGLCCTCAVSMNGAGRYLAKIFTSSVSMCDLYGTDACTSVCNIVIAGGGGGGQNIGGGGGAGGVVSATNTICADTYNVVIGAGGLGGNTPPTPSGSNSCFGSLANACGGGAGGKREGYDGCCGGSGGGGASANFSSECDGGACVTGQGNCGANGLSNSDQNYDAATFGAGGGGGGFSEQPPNATFSSPPTPAKFLRNGVLPSR